MGARRSTPHARVERRHAVTRSSGAGAVDPAIRDQLASLRALLGLSLAMTAIDDEAEILRLTTTAVPSLANCRTAGVRLDGAWLPESVALPDAEPKVDALSAFDRAGGPLSLESAGWAWAFPLAGLAGTMGHLLVVADAEPEEHERFLLGLLAQHVGSALVNARLHRQEQATATRERALVEELSASNVALERTVHEAERARAAAQGRLNIHNRLTQVVADGAAEEGIALAVYKLTGRPVAIEDRFGTLIAWAGPDLPDPYPKLPRAQRERLVRAALESGRPLRHGDRVLEVAQSRGRVLGVIAIIDPDNLLSELDVVALEHGATVLALELTYLRGVAETELRLGGDLVDDLLAGNNLDGILDRCRAIGYDLDRPHRVVVVEGGGRNADGDSLFQAVRRAARDLEVGSLLAGHAGRTCLLAEADAEWSAFRAAVLANLTSGGRCRVGVGGACSAPADFARSHVQAQLALDVQASLAAPDQVTAFDDLGVYRLLSEGADVGSMERFVQRWLGALLEYDASKGGDLVSTLTGYLECGGRYASAASHLSIHRSTLRYRLGRIREVSGHDLADPDTRFNLQLATRALSTICALRAN